MKASTFLFIGASLAIGFFIGKYWYSVKTIERFVLSPHHIVDSNSCTEACKPLIDLATDTNTKVSFNTARAAIQLYGSFTKTIADQFDRSLPASADSLKEDYKLNANDMPKSFFIPRKDLEDLLNASVEGDTGTVPPNGARVYLGVVWRGIHLFMVPTIENGGINEDVIPTHLVGEQHEQFVYDFITPCPAVCDPNSPLKLSSDTGLSISWPIDTLMENVCYPCQSVTHLLNSPPAPAKS